MQLTLGTTPICDVDEAVAQHLLFLIKGAKVVLASPPNVQVNNNKMFTNDDGMIGVFDKQFTMTIKLHATYNVETYTATLE